MNILEQIQESLLDRNELLTDTLRKAKILAHKLKSEELQNWVSLELNGYKSVDELPDYRVIKTSCVGYWTNGIYSVTNRGVPTYKIQDENLIKHLSRFLVFDGIRTVEELSKGNEKHFILPPDLTAYVNTFVRDAQRFGYAEIEYVVSSQDFIQIIDTVKNRLLDFILELSGSWDPKDPPPSRDDLKNIVNVHIYNSNMQGEQIMPTFDQRGQNVKYQYNAAGNIKFENVDNKDALIEILGNLRTEIILAKDAKVINQDVALEVEYNILQAEKEAIKPKPDKKKFNDYIGKAKDLLGDIAAAVNLIAALMKVAEIANNLLV